MAYGEPDWATPGDTTAPTTQEAGNSNVFGGSTRSNSGGA